MHPTQQNLPLDQMMQYLGESLIGVRGLLAIALFLGALALTVMFDYPKWIWLTLLLWIGSFGFLDGGQSRLDPVIRTISSPFSELRLYSRVICVGLLLLLLIPTIKSDRGQRWKTVTAATVAFFLLELAFSSRYLLSGEFFRAGLGMSTYVLIFLTLGVGLSQWLQTPADLIRLIRCLVASGILLVGGSATVFVLNGSAVVYGARLFGTTNNPQHLGITLGLLMPVACFLMLRKQERIFWRVGSGLFMGAGLIFIFWSGSRTGLLTGMIGLAILLRARIGLWLGVGIVCATLILIGIHFVGDQITGAAHLFATNDSRSEVWSRLWHEFAANPAIGSRYEGGGGENSYLSVAACFGVYGLLPMFVALWLIWIQVAKLNRSRKTFGSDSLLPNIVIAWIVSISLVWLFESYMIGTTTDFVFTLYIMLAVMAFLMDPPMMHLMRMEHASQPAYSSAAVFDDGGDNATEIDPLLGHSVPVGAVWETNSPAYFR